MFHSIPFTPRNVQATESRLKAVYDAAKLGLKGDTLALAAGMLPAEYRQLTQLDPVVEMAAQKGKADGEAMVIKSITTGPTVKLDDGTEENHKIIKTKDPEKLKNLAQWILSL